MRCMCPPRTVPLVVVVKLLLENESKTFLIAFNSEQLMVGDVAIIKFPLSVGCNKLCKHEPQVGISSFWVNPSKYGSATCRVFVAQTFKFGFQVFVGHGFFHFA